MLKPLISDSSFSKIVFSSVTCYYNRELFLKVVLECAKLRLNFNLPGIFASAIRKHAQAGLTRFRNF